MPQLLIATKNAHKTGEIAALLPPGWTAHDLTAHPEIPAPEETGATFAENAELKARAAARHFPDGLVLADDSGLEVDALGGAPGIYSARYAGANATDAENRAKLLCKLASVSTTSRRARFRCAMALVRGEELLGEFTGAVEGRLLPEETGTGGFGYDALFVPDGYEQSFAELPPEVKNQLSHRGRALAKVIEFLAGP